MKNINKEDDFTSFGRVLNHYLLRSGMTGEKLAEELGYTPEWISKYRNDHSLPSFDDVIEIAKILGMNPIETIGMLEIANYSIAVPIKRNVLIYKDICMSYYRTQNETAKK